MCSRRFTRLTNAFSKKLSNHTNAFGLHFFILCLVPHDYYENLLGFWLSAISFSANNDDRCLDAWVAVR